MSDSTMKIDTAPYAAHGVGTNHEFNLSSFRVTDAAGNRWLIRAESEGGMSVFLESGTVSVRPLSMNAVTVRPEVAP